MAFQTWSIIFIIICALNISVFTRVKSYYGADQISKLPGQPNVNFLQYSGYINVYNNRNVSLFYYFVEAESSPASKPLVLWLSGDPGCSSLGDGAFEEHGPFKPSGNILIKNNYSWNKVANMIYLDSPAGAGFSYSEYENFYDYTNDEIKARNNLNFLEKWLEKFPEFKGREFYIAGEEYAAGHYIPQLAKLIVQSKFMNLIGIAIGNPILEFDTDYNSKAEYLWSHGLISDYTLHQLTSVCNFSKMERQIRTHYGLLARECASVQNQVSEEMSSFVQDWAINLDACLSSVALQSQQNEPKIDVCIWDEIEMYFNRKDVQKALHARLVGAEKWSMCRTIAQAKMQDLETPTIGLLGSLVKSDIRVLVFSGDQDSNIPLFATRKLINGLAEKTLKLNTTRPYSPWFVGKQVAGGHKAMVTCYHMQRYEELRKMRRGLSPKERSFSSLSFLMGNHCHWLMTLYSKEKRFAPLLDSCELRMYDAYGNE